MLDGLRQVTTKADGYGNRKSSFLVLPCGHAELALLLHQQQVFQHLHGHELMENSMPWRFVSEFSYETRSSANLPPKPRSG